MKIFISLFFVLSISCKLLGQSFYVVDGNSQIKKITIKGTTLSQENLTSCIPFTNTIAIHKGTFYSIWGTITKSTIASGNQLINCTNISVPAYGNALTADANGILYLVNQNQLYKADPANSSITLLGELPYFVGGDLVFYKGALYMAAEEGIVKIDLSDLSKSKLVIPSNALIWGLTAVPYSSTENKIYAMIVNINNGNTSIIELDLNNNTFGPTVGTLPFSVNDAASDVEDDTLLPITIDAIDTYADCPFTGRGSIQVRCVNSLIDYKYTLNNTITNTTGIFTNLTPGTYHLTVSSDIEQKDQDITITAFPVKKPNLTITKTDPQCFASGEIKIAAANDGNLYKIRYGNDVFDFDHTFDNLTAGNYHFTIVNGTGCTVDETDVNLTQAMCPITINAKDVSEECNNPGRGVIRITTVNSPDTYTYTLNTTINNTGIFNNIDPGNYTIHIASSGGDAKDIAITVPDYNLTKPVITSTTKNPVCDAAGEIKFNIGNGSAALYRIRAGADIYPFDHVFSNLNPGTFHFDIINSTECIVTTQEVTLTRDKCIIQLNSSVVTEECNAPGYGVIKIDAQPHTAPYTYTINNNETNATGVFNHLQPGNYHIKVTSDEDEKELDLNVPDYNATKPAIGYVAIRPECEVTGNIKLSLPNTDTHNYTIRYAGSIYPFDHQFTGLSEAIYRFDVLKPDGCLFNTIDIPLTRKKCDIVLLSADVTQECNIAFKGSIHVNSNPHTYTYTYWLNNSNPNNTGIFNNVAPGSYQIKVTSSEDEQTISAIVPDYKATEPIITFTTKKAICELKGEVQFNMQINSSQYKIIYKSNTYTFDHIFNGLDEGEQVFTVLKPDGCLLDNFSINIEKEGCEIVAFPNTFTPNNDGINDIFQPTQNSKADNFKLYIYTRAGIQVFSSINSHTGWDGSINGKPAPVGVYYWKAAYTNNEGKSLIKSGYVTLIR
ncbi:gliding motility-associated C-terminal domain-containing protein [Mucilaginibacter mali]|uniref:Gliding motility-associated C-terminal domain-containing protein n=1 Tax=Mucilaginibacter mali TaxID=2740462 RepID=A0A7D4QJD1_9SPHI|nr:gliding motility-associated C-terminal domain-containing protein [Mucilaginibacter mali]QKJ29710.1 gliding motility-associated C-terminal domain-containing protein [Mucilaginibacter mali]